MDKNKLKLTFLLTVSALPIVLATWVFGLREMQGVSSTTNKGELIIPVLDITALGLTDSAGLPLFKTFEEETANLDPELYEPAPWKLIYLGSSNCDGICEERLYFLRQLHARLSGEADRVERYYVNADKLGSALTVFTTKMFAEQFPAMKLSRADYNALLQTLAATLPEGVDPVAEHYILLADPVGNVMLYFHPENSPEEILSDLDKLLDQSSLG